MAYVTALAPEPPENSSRKTTETVMPVYKPFAQQDTPLEPSPAPVAMTSAFCYVYDLQDYLQTLKGYSANDLIESLKRAGATDAWAQPSGESYRLSPTNPLLWVNDIDLYVFIKLYYVSALPLTVR